MKKRLMFEIIVLIIILLNVLIFSFIFRPLIVSNVDYILDGKNIKAEIYIIGNKKELTCEYNNEVTNAINGKCTISIPNEKVEITISNNYRDLKYTLTPNMNKIVDFTLSNDKVYLVLDEEKEISFSIETIGNPTEDIVLTSKDENIASCNKNIIIGKTKGTTTVTAKVGKIAKEIEVTVTDLLTKPIWKGQDKSLIPCHIYSEEEVTMLDEFLEYRINNAGYQTRAGAIAAARFLTLELPYRIPYFFENGRYHESGVHFVEGEGRYYRKGLYLSDSKMESIKHTWTGPAIWGCPLKNLENSPLNGYYSGQLVPNGLDCSGFVTWVLKQAGYDIGDIGAMMIAENIGDVQLTPELINSGKIQVGDLFSYWGHISILVGDDGDNYYIAESLPGPRYDGATVKKYSKKTVYQEFVNVNLMDDFYKEKGVITTYWE